MWNWLRRIFCGTDRGEVISSDAEVANAEPPPWAQELLEQLAEREGERPGWATEMTELVQKSARVQSKNALRLEELDRKLEGGLLDLRQTLSQALSSQATARTASALRWDDVLDAMDLLDAAHSSLLDNNPSVAQGLGRIVERLERHVAQGGIERMRFWQEVPDGSLVRVVGTEEHTDLPDGVVTRVVRAAVRQGDRVLREGEVLTNRRPS